MDKQKTPYPCVRCQLTLSSGKSYISHLHYALNHNICHLCPGRRDFETFAELQVHLEQFHLYCEPCQWFAPSAVGLRQHNTSKHYLCIICGDYFPNAHELNGHAFRHRRRGVKCYCCNQDFSTLSAMFNHMESGNCASEIQQHDILTLAADFVRPLPYGDGHVFFCVGCRKTFRRMCDLLQHSETSACGDGYWKGSGHVGLMVTYIGKHIRSLPQARQAKQQPNQDHSPPDSIHNPKANPPANIPRIVISEAP
ncbi:hypothetical protein FQN57_002366 [Myotisia sp. PD_48]|nr:hypothetical protein FQN57_002366 [Myotisia sp. PD_48]